MAARSTIAGHAGEVLHQHARGRVRDLIREGSPRHPAGEGLDVPGGDRLAVLVAQQVLQQHLQRVRQPCHVVLRLERVEPEDLVGGVPDTEVGSGSIAVGVAHVQNPIDGPPPQIARGTCVRVARAAHAAKAGAAAVDRSLHEVQGIGAPGAPRPQGELRRDHLLARGSAGCRALSRLRLCGRRDARHRLHGPSPAPGHERTGPVRHRRGGPGSGRLSPAPRLPSHGPGDVGRTSDRDCARVAGDPLHRGADGRLLALLRLDRDRVGLLPVTPARLSSRSWAWPSHSVSS